MLSTGARSRQAVRKSYVCLSCQLRAQQHREQSTEAYELSTAEGTQPKRKAHLSLPATNAFQIAVHDVALLWPDRVEDVQISAARANATASVNQTYREGRSACTFERQSARNDERVARQRKVQKSSTGLETPVGSAVHEHRGRPPHRIRVPITSKKHLLAGDKFTTNMQRMTESSRSVRSDTKNYSANERFDKHLDTISQGRRQNEVGIKSGQDNSSSEEQWKEIYAARKDEFDAILDAHLDQSWRSMEQQKHGDNSTPSTMFPLSMRSGFGRAAVSSLPLNKSVWNEARTYHTSGRRFQQAVVTSFTDHEPPSLMSSLPSENPNGIRAQLRRWQDLHGEEAERKFNDQLALAATNEEGETNNLTRLSDTNDLRQRRDEEQEEAQAVAYFSSTQAEYMETGQTDPRFLRMGDLVELEFTNSEKESILAIYIRRNGPESLFYTIQGRWAYLPERQVQYAIPGWVSKDAVEPIIPFLPTEEQMDDMDALKREAYVKDLSVPRYLAAPLVNRMAAFHRESLEIYRKHASALDNAHQILAHDTDLRYGSLNTAATALLKIPADQISLAALYTVRKALMHAGFAFNVDRRSHRLTGYLQIRSKEQVKMVEQVRMWLREWQDDLAAIVGMSEKQLARHRHSRGAEYVNAFLSKAKKIIAKSRENREATVYGNVGPSKTKYTITPDQDAVKITTGLQFDEHDHELVRFVEAWACNNMFLGLPRISGLPPLLLQATGMYPDKNLDKSVGFVFLQELGTIMPYENRVRFDQHLLLPSSQHSKPLQTLMTSLITMAKEPKFSDSMADLRHDWGNLPVYCIDAASAHEIDDGISVERANPKNGETSPEWWIHIHIANPTAFISREHPLAKMARHMGESIYMPERAYMMLPRWATQRHFSLARKRPCLTFSARVNERGETLEKNIKSGYIRNVLRITPDEVKQLIGLNQTNQSPEIVLTVGGDPPPSHHKPSSFSNMTEANVQDLKILHRLAEGRTDHRRAAGGIFFDQSKPEVSVWQTWKGTGLSWDHPHRKGSRTVEGDPIIQLTTHRLTNYFTAAKGNTDILVREMMLLACEISTAWCAERQVPTIYRGSVPKPDQIDAATFYREVCEPAMANNNGEIPLHLGLQYIQAQGSVVLSTRPLKHNLLGLDHYGKVTSPLRRYGDMILHWQIEAVLREEARLGRSLTTRNPNVNLSFLPFSRPVLDAIATGLRPRENMVQRAKFYAEHFWTSMLMFRAHHFGEAKLPWDTLHAYLPSKPWSSSENVVCICEEINTSVTMLRPESFGLPAAKVGDRWECVLQKVEVFDRLIFLKPVRLVDRWEG